MEESGDQNTKIDGDNNTVNNVKQSASENQVILPKEIYRENIENAVRVKELEMQATHGKEREIFQAQIDKLNNDLANLPKYLKKTNALITRLKIDLENMLELMLELGNYEALIGKLTVAKADLEKGYFSKTDEFLYELEVFQKSNSENSFRASLLRAEIAQHEVRWKDAVEHCARAVKLNPCFITLMKAQILACDMGDYPSALSLGVRTQKAAIKEHGEESKEYANFLSNIAGIFLYNNDGKSAESLFNKTLKINIKFCGENHPDTANNLNSLGGAYELQGNYTKAESFYKQALEIYIKNPNENPPNTARCLNNLGCIYRIQKKYKKSESFHKEALNIRRDALGDNHPDTAGSLNHLGALYQEQGRHEEASPLYLQALEILESRLGPDHPHTKDVKANYEQNKNLNKKDSGEIADARENVAEKDVSCWFDADNYYARAAQFDPCYRNLILAEKFAIDTGDYDSALSLGEEAKKAAFKEQGKDSKEYATSLNNLGTVYSRKEQYKKAEMFYKESLKIRQDILEKKHPDVAISLNSLGVVYLDQKQYREATYFLKRSLNIYKEAFGMKHLGTADVLNNLGCSYRDMREFKRAKPLFKQALKIRKEILGDNHPDIANSYNSLGGLYSMQGQYKKAEPYFRQALEILETTLGPDHPHTILVKGYYEKTKKVLANP